MSQAATEKLLLLQGEFAIGDGLPFFGPNKRSLVVLRQGGLKTMRFEKSLSPPAEGAISSSFSRNLKATEEKRGA